MKKNIYLIVFLLVINFNLHAEDSKGRIIVTVDAFRTDKGIAEITLFKSNNGFPDEPEKAYKNARIKVKMSSATYTFENIPFGVYAVSIYHDEHSLTKADENKPDVPKEGYGVSNNIKVKELVFKPSFDDAKFELKSKEIEINIKVQYH